MFIAAAVLSFSLMQDPVPIRITEADFRALESCVAAARDPIHCGLEQDVAQVALCLSTLPPPTAADPEKWVEGRMICIEHLPCQWWKPAPDQEDSVLLLEACSAREWGVLKSVSAMWLQRLRPHLSEEEFADVLALEKKVIERVAAAEAEERAAATPRRGTIAGSRTGGWGAYFMVLQILLYEAEGHLPKSSI